MVYIYKKTINGKPYYYLRHSQRIGDKTIIKDIAYLGSTLHDVEQNLEKLPALKKEIKKAYKSIKHFFESEYYIHKAEELKLKQEECIDKKEFHNIEACKLHFHERFLHLDATTQEEIYKNFVIEFTFNTTSMEGNTITLAEAHRLLREQLTPNQKTLREVYDIQNTEKAFFFILNNKEKITHEFIIMLHTMLMEKIDVRKGYRTFDVRVFGKKFESTPAPYVKTDMDILLQLLGEKIHPFVLASIFHHNFEKIHPFADGNGRTGRMLLMKILLENGYPAFVIRRSKRKEYLHALSKADSADLKDVSAEHYKPLVMFLAKEFIQSYWNTFLF